MIRLLLPTLLIATLATQALATTGWDRHEQDVLRKFRIHGANGASYVHRLDGTGRCIEPALCGTVDAKGVWNGLRGPPDYAVAGSQLVVRYPAESAPNHFLIDIDHGTVVGPLSASEFHQAHAGTRWNWETPITAADQFQGRLWFIIVGVAAISAACLAVVAVVFRKHRGLRQNARLCEQLANKRAGSKKPDTGTFDL